ncbi:hypothetical protein ACTR7Z_004923, partial [Escherichia coli]
HLLNCSFCEQNLFVMYQVDDVLSSLKPEEYGVRNFQLSFKGVCRIFSPFLPVLALPQFSQKRQTSPQPAP